MLLRTNRSTTDQGQPHSVRTAITVRKVALALFLLLVVAPNHSHAEKGGNGGGNGGGGGGGDPPVTAPVSYTVTPVANPGTTFYYNDHNNGATVVGWDPVATQAVAYLPSISSSTAFYLDDPALGVVGIPEGWHTRSALGVNNQGSIVGNLMLDGSENITRKPYLLDTSPGTSPQLTVLGPFDTASETEVALQINDSGDIVAMSQKTVNGNIENSIYVGNPGLGVSFTQIHLPSGWNVFDYDVMLSNRIGSSPAILASTTYDENGERHVFRIDLDGNNFEASPVYTNSEDGSQNYWYGFSTLDLNDSGDVAGGAYVKPAKKGKTKNNYYGAVWEIGSNEYLPAASDNALQSEWDRANNNNSGDFLLVETGPEALNYLWHDDWSATNGAIGIADLIDPDDANRHLFNRALEMTDHGSTDWPTIIANSSVEVDGQYQNSLLILEPVLNASSSAMVSTSAVPEPSGIVLAMLAGVGVLLRNRRVRKVS
jgi:hypothetical protein